MINWNKLSNYDKSIKQKNLNFICLQSRFINDLVIEDKK